METKMLKIGFYKFYEWRNLIKQCKKIYRLSTIRKL